jgi:predicted dehydrogenase
MLKIGSVGTSTIMQTIQEAIRQTPGMTCQVVYSRNLQKGRQFADSVGVPEVCDDFEELVSREDLDVIDIASPNVLHASQVICALEHGKHVIVEKPAGVTAAEVEAMQAAATAHGVYFFEAITTLYQPNFLAYQEVLGTLGAVKEARIAFGRYSSKYNDYLAGKNPNIFNPEMKTGALNDMGIYCIHTAVGLFGAPQQVSYQAELGSNGIDLGGTLTMQYPGMLCMIECSKSHDMENGCLVKTTDGQIEAVGDLNDFPGFTVQKGTHKETVSLSAGENRMLYEMKRFRDAIENREDAFFARMCEQSRIAASILEQAHA